MAQIRNVNLVLTLGNNISEFDFAMSERVVYKTIQFTPRIETQDLVIPIGTPQRYDFSSTLISWDSTLIDFSYE